MVEMRIKGVKTGRLVRIVVVLDGGRNYVRWRAGSLFEWWLA